MREQQGRRWLVGVGGPLLLLVLWACGGGSESGSPSMVVSMHGERLSAKLRQAPVGIVLAGLAGQTGIYVYVDDAAATETVSAEFANLPLEEGIKRILQGTNYALTYADEQRGRVGTSTIMAIRVLAPGAKPPSSAAPILVAAGPQPQKAPAEGRKDSTSGSSGAPSPLASALRDDDPQVRRAAVKALGDAGDESSVGALGQLLTGDGDKQVRRAAIEALAEIGSPAVLSTLGRALHDSDRRVRRKAEDAILAIGGEQALTRLRQAAQYQD